MPNDDEAVVSNGIHKPEDAQKRILSSRIVILRDGVSESSANCIISLVHPGYGKRTMFYLTRAPAAKLYEIQKVVEEYRCWMVDGTLRTDNQMYLITPMDPLFMLLPYLRDQCATRAIPLEHVLASAEDPKLVDIADTIKNVHLIADARGPESLSAYIYNEEKTMKWLEGKVRKVAEVLKTKDIYVKAGAASSTFVSASREGDAIDEAAHLRYAHGIVAEYLSEELGELLRAHLALPAEADCAAKRKSLHDEPATNAHKRVKTEDMDSFQEAHSNIIKKEATNDKTPPVAAAAKESSRDKLNRRAAAGSKNIMSFFGTK